MPFAEISLLLLLIGVLAGIESCHCPHIWEPICATDAQLYSNMCFFLCARINQPGLLPQDMTACNPDPNAAGGGENEGNLGQGILPTGTNAYQPDPTFNSAFGFLPVCTWTCRKIPTTSTFHSKICDDVGAVHTSDCEFYKAVCKAELGGYLLRRGPCRRSRPLTSNRRKTWMK